LNVDSCARAAYGVDSATCRDSPVRSPPSSSCSLRFRRAQDAPRGVEFWLAFLEPLGDATRPADPLSLVRLDVVAGESAADVHVEVPAGGWSADVALAAHAAGSVIVPSALVIASGSETPDLRGVHVSASAPVTLSAVNHVPGSADASIVLPVVALGNDYLVATYDPFVLDPGLSGPAELVVVAVEDSTTVEITPSAPTRAGRPAGTPFTVRLDRGMTYQLQSMGNLTGTRVRTLGTPCDRIAVFAGNVMALVDSCNSVDHLYEQMLPRRSLGTEYRVVPFAARTGGDIVEIVASEDGTLVGVAGASPVALDAGGRLRMRIDAASRIGANRPVAVFQYERGRTCDGAAAGDPSMVQLRPLARDTLVDVVAPGALTFERHFLSIVTPTADAASVLVDGVPPGGFAPFADDPATSWTRAEVSAGAHTIAGRSIAGVVSHGIGPAISYAVDPTGVPSLAPGPDDAAITSRCSCERLVLEAPEGFVRYRWSSGDTTRAIIARSSGEYSVTVERGACRIVSAATSVVVPAPASIALEPRRDTVDPGEILPATLVVEGAGDGTCAPPIDRVVLRFRSSMLAIAAAIGGPVVGDSIDGPDHVVTIVLSRDTVLLDLVAAFGDTTAVSIVLAAAGDDTCLVVRGDTLAVYGVTACDVGGRRLFLDAEGAAITAIRPTPARDIATVDLRILEAGRTRLEIVDPLGRRVSSLVDGTFLPGDHSISFDVSALPPGIYRLLMTTPTRRLVQPLVVAR
jgi:hypothetical protein